MNNYIRALYFCDSFHVFEVFMYRLTFVVDNLSLENMYFSKTQT